MSKIDLKERLMRIKDNNWIIPDKVDVYELSLEMIDNIGTTDYILRDSLICAYI